MGADVTSLFCFVMILFFSMIVYLLLMGVYYIFGRERDVKKSIQPQAKFVTIICKERGREAE